MRSLVGLSVARRPMRARGPTSACRKSGVRTPAHAIERFLLLPITAATELLATALAAGGGGGCDGGAGGGGWPAAVAALRG